MNRLPHAVALVVVLLAGFEPSPAGAQTRLVKDLNTAAGIGSFPSGGVFFKGKLYFTADEGGVEGRQVWSSDGTAQGTAKICATPCRWSNASSSQLKEFNGSLYFLANSQELWKTDGTTTAMVMDLGPAATNVVGSNMEVFEGALYFMTTAPATTGTVWRTDGTSAGTVAAGSLSVSNFPSTSISLQATPRGLYATVSLGSFGSLYRLDHGSFTSIAGAAHGIGPLRSFGSFDYFSFFGASDIRLYRTDGTASGTSQFNSCTVAGVVVLNGSLYYGCPYFGGAGLYKSDGTSQGTATISSLQANDLVDANGRLMFSDGELGKSDGTAAGTVRVLDINPGANSYPSNLTVSGSELFFFANDGTHGEELWRSDGTAPGTTLVQDINPGSGAGKPSTVMITPTPLGVFFSANDGQSGPELYLLPSIALYRLYSDATKEHLYTTDAFEDYTLGTFGWLREGVAFRLYPDDALQQGIRPIGLHRLYHPFTRQHLWTTDANEAAVLPQRGWTYEGLSGYVLPSAIPGSAPLYRMALASPPLHLWTTDPNEYQVLQGLGWAPEGFIGHVIR